MELNNRQKKWYNLGVEMAKKFNSEECACREMDGNTLEELALGTWSNEVWFHVGFIGRAPEYVQAVRFGKIPEGGRSRNHAEGKLEMGVSCVKIVRTDADRDAKSLYDVTLGYQGVEKTVISGWYLGGSGSDGEPLLIDCK